MSTSENSRDAETLGEVKEEPDIMNDPAYNIRTKGKEKDVDDVDTCRICRGEGSQEEPLFYPCKCSGSIKFVHQNCLMEWLAHSQKKHCELCKTPFRFTKLYHPQMPSTVPIPVFLRQAALHGWSSFQTWTRFQMVCFVWVFWLPWCMRTIWRGLFWIGDGAWVDWSNFEEQLLLRNYTRLSSPLNSASNTSSNYSSDPREAAVATFIDYFGSKAIQVINSNPWRKEPISLSLAKRIYQFLSGRYAVQDVTVTGVPNATNVVEIMPRSSTWLSDVKFFSTMTRSTTVNNIIIDTLEGQLITLFVVIAFILIFLIREWVMQQQQNMLLGPNGENEEAGGPNIDVPAQPHPDHRADEQNPAVAGPEENPGPRLFVRPRRRINRPLPPAFGDRVENERPPTGEYVAPQQPTLAGTQNSMTSPSTDSQQLLPLKHDQNGDNVDPPVDLDNLLQESSIVQNILQRVQNDPSLDVLTIIRNEIPPFEVDGLLQRLRASEVAPYLEAHDFDTFLPAAEGLGDVEAHGEQQDTEHTQSTGDEKHIEFLTTSRSGSGSRGTSNEDSDVGSSIINDTNQNAGAFQTAFVPQRHRHINAQDGAVLVDDAFEFGDNVEGTTPTRNLLRQPSPRTIDRSIEEESVINDVKRESSHESSLSKSTENKEDMMDGFELLQRLEKEEVESGKEEGSNIQKSPPEPVSVDVQDERAHTPDSDGIHDQGYFEALKNWLWGDVTLPPEPVEQPIVDEEHIVGNIAEEEPFVPIAHGQHLLHPPEQGANQARDPEVLAAAAQAGVDPNEVEGVDDMEDLEGIMELIGMEGPLAGLMQNGMFCAVLVSLTIFFGVWIPYMFGKIFLTFLASPVSLPLRLIQVASTSADMVVDSIVLCAGGFFYWIDASVNLLCQPLVWILPAIAPYINNNIVAQTSIGYAERALDRLMKASITTGEGLPQVIDIPTFSIVAHESLWHMKLLFRTASQTISHATVSLISSLLECPSIMQGLEFLSLALANRMKSVVGYCIEDLLALASATPSIVQMNPLRLTLATHPRTSPLNLELATWNTTDRTVAIAAGYALFALLGILYLYVAGTLRGTNKKGVVNGSLAQVLYQAGGVLKVILIISIEMIVFPLYCGLLLDIALLPLFGNVTLASRVSFTTTSPWTSMFVHWFVGTCYMFHFALFVSMCRKIMRPGVLYFIRDPDDPTFHPVRDVLERSVSSQLWKISFSALVYGGLVLLCLGGVVWGIEFAFKGIFPIHWSSDEPVLEFPVDLLFYNFLMPMAVKFFKPSVGLNKIYGWWFRKCARQLRLSSFLFNNTRSDEQGRHVRRTWTDVLQGLQGDIQSPIIGEDRRALWEDRGARAIFLRDGRYVQAPGSDQVRITKGAATFIEVDEENHRLDGIKDGDEDPQGRKMNLFMKVYIPPYFGTRIAAFICLIWLFAATTGVGVTIIPLLLGRWIFAQLTPNHLRTNDIYAFSMGIYILGGAAWILLNHRRITKYIHDAIAPHTISLTSAVQKAKDIAIRALALLYVYSAIGILLPCLFSLILECYLIIPLQTYLLENASNINESIISTDSILSSTRSPYPVIHLIQDWTLGVLYIKTFARLILWTEPSRPALALRAIVVRGWLSPDVRLATRALILPATLIMAIILTLPLPIGWAANQTLLHRSFGINSDHKNHPVIIPRANTAFSQAAIYRYSYPAVLALVTVAALLWLLRKLLRGWRRKIRDEVYLIGERLHNFGEGAKAGAISRVRVGKMAMGRAAPVAPGGEE